MRVPVTPTYIDGWEYDWGAGRDVVAASYTLKGAADARECLLAEGIEATTELGGYTAHYGPSIEHFDPLDPSYFVVAPIPDIERAIIILDTLYESDLLVFEAPLYQPIAKELEPSDVEEIRILNQRAFVYALIGCIVPLVSLVALRLHLSAFLIDNEEAGRGAGFAARSLAFVSTTLQLSLFLMWISTW